MAIVGPTATGKSDVALALAHLLDAEIVNADAMQLYRGMDIGTAKISAQQRAAVPHHQLDVLDVTQEASVAAYQRHARADIDAVRARGRRVIVTGGSGLYLRALLDHFTFPPKDGAVRTALERRADVEGTAVLYEELVDVDPDAAARIDPANTTRIVRALEVIAVTGAPFTASLPEYEYAVPAVQIGLRMDQDVLDERIRARVDAMWDAGLATEVRSLLAIGLRDGVTASRAVGYAEMIRHLDGEIDEAETRMLIERNTRRLARRQRRWFARDPRIGWFTGPTNMDQVGQVAEQIAAQVT